MKKKVLSVMLSVAMVASVLAGCGSTAEPAAPAATDDAAEADADADADAEEADADADAEDDAEAEESADVEKETMTAKPANGGGEGTINLWSFTNEIPGMVEKYVEDHPDFPYVVESTIIATTNGAYQPALDQALANGEVDMYAAEEAFVIKYTQGDMSSFAAPYEDLGIDVDAELKAADIAPYTVDVGTNPDGKLVALGYQTTGGAMIYRRSIAKEVFGTDDPKKISEIVGGGSGSFDKFWEAAKTLKDAGYPIVSSDGDIWNVCKHDPSSKSWIDADGKLQIDDSKLAFMDYAKDLYDNDWSNKTSAWGDAWFADMSGTSDANAFCFFGPAWLINYTIGANCGGEKVGEGTYGDWAVCDSPVGFFWGGTWVMCANDTDDAKKEAIKDLIYWITLDSTEDGLQYKWANGTLNGEGGTKDTVASGTVMGKSDGSLEFLGGQNMFDYFIPANKFAKGDNMTQYDETINNAFTDQVSQYATGEKDKDAAIADFKDKISTELGIEVAE